MPQKKTYILFFSALLTALLAIGVFLFIFHTIKAKNETASALSQKIDEDLNAQQNVATLEKTISDTKEKSALLHSYVVDENSVPTFVGWVEDQGTAIGVPVTITSVLLSTTAANTLSVEFTATASFASIMRLVSLMQYAPYQVHITKVNLNKVVDAPAPSSPAPNSKATPAPSSSGWQLDMSFDVISNTFSTK